MKHLCIYFMNASQSNCYGTSCAWHFYDVLVLPSLTSQTALVGISNEFTIDKNKLLKNHIILVFKLHSYSSQKKHKYKYPIEQCSKSKRSREKIASNNEKKADNEWYIVYAKIQNLKKLTLASFVSVREERFVDSRLLRFFIILFFMN